METEIIKPEKNIKKPNHIVNAILYLILGIILAFKSNEAFKLVFYVLGVLLIVYGIKLFLDYYRNQSIVQYKNINISISIISVIGGLLLIILAGVINLSLRYILGFFLIYLGISRLLSDISFGEKMTFSILSNVILIVLGIYSIFVSNVLFVIIGWILIANAIILFVEYLRK